MRYYRVCSMGHFQSFESNLKDAKALAETCKESLELLDIDPNDPDLGVTIDAMEVPSDKEGLRAWLNQNYAC